MKQRGFTVVEFILIVVAIAILAGVGYFVYQKRVNNKYSTSPEAIEQLNKEDPYYQMEPSPARPRAEVEAENNANPYLRKETTDTGCGQGSYEIIGQDGSAIGCSVAGGE